LLGVGIHVSEYWKKAAAGLLFSKAQDGFDPFPTTTGIDSGEDFYGPLMRNIQKALCKSYDMGGYLQMRLVSRKRIVRYGDAVVF